MMSEFPDVYPNPESVGVASAFLHCDLSSSALNA
jgi:hypothetical protein